jgi:hypothetical protein
MLDELQAKDEGAQIRLGLQYFQSTKNAFVLLLDYLTSIPFSNNPPYHTNASE